jgi:hypothetical protein
MLASTLLLVACGNQAAHRPGARSTATGDRQGAQAQPASVRDGDWRTFDYDSHRGRIAVDEQEVVQIVPGGGQQVPP